MIVELTLLMKMSIHLVLHQYGKIFFFFFFFYKGENSGFILNPYIVAKLYGKICNLNSQ
jgi:hypothetical protein